MATETFPITTRARLRDVAQLAGVSPKTVSRVLNGHPSVSPDTAARVRQAAAALRFRPNRLARDLRQGAVTDAVGMVVGDLANPFYAQVAAHAERALRERGLELFLSTSDEDPERERHVIRTLLERRVQALIVIPSSDDHSYLEPELQLGTPLVFLDRPPVNLRAHSVVLDNRNVTRRVTEDLLALGHRRVALLADALTTWTASERVAGALEALRSVGSHDPDLVVGGLSGSVQSGERVARLLESPDPPTAYLCLNNRITLGALRVFRGTPDPPALIGFDDFETAELLGISVLHHDVEELAANAVEMVITDLHGPGGPARQVVLPTTYVPRGSGERPPPSAPPATTAGARTNRMRSAMSLQHGLALPVSQQDDAWLTAQADRLLDAAAASRAQQGGFWWLGDDGTPVTAQPRYLWIAARMTHIFSLGTLLGRAGDALLADHGVSSLAETFRDAGHGGWFAAVTDSGPVPGPKGAYEHAFVVLAASSATLAGRRGARELLDQAITVIEERFWDEDAGAMVEEWDRDWSTLDPYRGTNANMHSVEAFLAAADATGEDRWLDRALRIMTRIVDGEGRSHGWRLPEHHGADWTVLPEYNLDQPDHPFRPYGVTPGHGMEWARLALHLDGALRRRGLTAPDWLVPAALELFDRAHADGWDRELGGFCYTTDWNGKPVVDQQFHWVICEAIAAAAALHRVTGQERFADAYSAYWAHARAVFLRDGKPGWLHEADRAGEPSHRTWSGRPDTYHALQTALVPRLPLDRCFAAALRAEVS
ncbi:MAG: sulfoquinovose isomerase [Actinomycetota bacterium]|nr:sulfoquinovose isomerase [Actinomycetota bacterium]